MEWWTTTVPLLQLLRHRLFCDGDGDVQPSGGLPGGRGRSICNYHHDDGGEGGVTGTGGAGGSTGAGGVHTSDAGPDAAAGGAGNGSTSNGCSCTVGARDPRQVVLGGNLAAVLLGLALDRRRRTSKK